MRANPEIWMVCKLDWALDQTGLLWTVGLEVRMRLKGAKWQGNSEENNCHYSSFTDLGQGAPSVLGLAEDMKMNLISSCP